MSEIAYLVSSAVMASELGMLRTLGLIGGQMIQLAEGSWPGEIGVGVALNDDEFDLIEPCVRDAYSDWTAGDRSGVFDLTAAQRPSLVASLRKGASQQAASEELRTASLFAELADWLEARCDERAISVLGY